MRKIDALEGGITVGGARIPRGWAGGLAQLALDRRMTRAELVRQTMDEWLKKNPQYTSVQQAAEALDRSYGMQFRQILEDELPSACPRIEEYRGDGRRYAEAIRKGKARRNNAIGVVDVPLLPHVRGFLERISAAHPEDYPNIGAVVSSIITRWVDAQKAKQEQK
jgi:hypothetical protein